jgi:hypothetical protein
MIQNSSQNFVTNRAGIVAGTSPGLSSEQTGVNFLESQEALVGTRVRVLETDRRPELRGMLGTIEHRWGHPDHAALDVRLDDGQAELFWFHGLETVREYGD